MSQTHCPDCGGEYKRYEDYYGQPQELRVRATTELELAAEAHRDFECPIQKERDHAEALERAVRYFGIADTLKKIAELMGGENEHDAELIWGNGERYFRREQERGGGIGTPRGLSLVTSKEAGEGSGMSERDVNCPKCGVRIGTTPDGKSVRAARGSALTGDAATAHIGEGVLVSPLEGEEPLKVGCGACGANFTVTEALSVEGSKE
jgi:DNA-directed RNA polymerase subunit RPC12/RpoP